MDALIFLLRSLYKLVACAFLLRLLLQLFGANFRNPLCQAVLSLTSWLVLPLRKVIPPFGRVDTASLVAFLLVELAGLAVTLQLGIGGLPAATDLLGWSLREALVTVLQTYTVAILLYALLSLLTQGQYHPLGALLAAICEPVLTPLRRVIPPVGGLDFSPLVVLLLLQAAKMLIT